MANAPEYDLIYDPADGSITFDTNGGRILNYALENKVPGGGSFRPENHVSPLTTGQTGTVSSSLDTIASTNLGAPFLFDPVNIGAVMPVGLTESEFLNFFTRADYVPNLGTGLDFELHYGQPATRQPAADANPFVGQTGVKIGVQGLFDANGQPPSSPSKTMAVIDVDGDGLAGFDFSNWDGSSFLPDPDDVLVSDPVRGVWNEATGDGGFFEDQAPAGVRNSVLDSGSNSQGTEYNVTVVSSSLNADTAVGAGDRVFLFYFPELPIDATEPGPFQSFGVVEVGSLSDPGEVSNFFSIGLDTVYLADNSTGEGVLANLATVPEPASLSLLAMGGVMALRRRRG